MVSSTVGDQHAAALERVGHVAGDDPLREPLDDGGLPDPGLTDEHRVVLGAPGEHLDDATDLGIAPDDRVEPTVLGDLGEVDAVLVQRLVRRLGVLRGDPPVAPDRGQTLAQTASPRPASVRTFCAGLSTAAIAMSRCSLAT